MTLLSSYRPTTVNKPELVILMGIPGSGKSTFYVATFFHTHMRISLDLFNTRNKENRFMELAFSLQQRMVLDNTNVTRGERREYIEKAKQNQFVITGYYFESKLADCLERNEQRTGKGKINKIGILAKYKALELPNYDECFDQLYYVSVNDGKFNVKEWNNEI